MKDLIRRSNIVNSSWWINVGSVWSVVSLAFLATCLLLRLYMMARLSLSWDFDTARSLTILSGFYFDLFLFCRVAVWAIIPFLLLSLLSLKWASRCYTAVVAIYTLLYVCLVEYFVNTKLPLDHVLLAYSFHDICDIVKTSTSISAWFFAELTLFLLWSCFLFWVVNRLKFSKWCAAILLVVALSVELVSNYKNILYNELPYSSTAKYNLAVNQLSYAWHKLGDFKQAETDYLTYEELMSAAARFQKHYPDVQYLGCDYPFMHVVNDPDVLGPFFEITSDSVLPNVVVIIVESWGEELSCVPSSELSFTPFLDSLAAQSLYWKNCLSTTERTFGILPALFASAPFGDKGFANSWVPIPHHHSLFIDLSRHGYQSAFYYGGCAAFNGQDRFLKHHGVKNIMEVNMDHIDSATSQMLKDFNRWGIDDKEMFAMAIDKRSRQKRQRPYIEVYQTLTSHEPFLFEGVETYIEKVKRMAEKYAQVLDKQPAERDMLNKYPQYYASFLYVDDCIRELFDYYRCQPDFENTIFIITGDHRAGIMVNDNPLSMYHVPLIVYSPLLKQSKEMAAVVSHLDVVPTLNAYLKNSYAYSVSDECCWLGTSLDTNRQFRSLKRMAFMRNNRDVIDYLHDNYFISNQRLYRVRENLQVEPLKDEAKLKQLTQARTDYSRLNRYVSNDDYLLNPVPQQRKPVCRYYWDFEQVIPGYYKDIIQKDAQGNHVAIANPRLPYLPLMLPTRLEDDYDRLYLDFSFDVTLSNGRRPGAVIIVDISDKQGSVCYKYFDIYSEAGQPVNPQTPMRGRLKTMLLLNDVDVKGKIMKVTLQQKRGTIVHLDNLKAQVEAEK